MSDGLGTERPQYPIGSVDNALRLLVMLEHTRRLRVSDVARDLGVAASTAHRLLSMLAYYGFVERDSESGTYKVGSRLVRIGLSAVRALDVRALAHPILERFAESVDETVHLAQLEGTAVRFIDCTETSRALRVISRVGRTLPAHATSVGKSMLARLEPASLVLLYPEEVLSGPEMTAQTIRSRTTLLRVLGEVRRRGFAMNRNESENGVSSVGVALSSHTLSVPTGLSVAAPSARVDGKRLVRLAELLQAAASEVDAELDRWSGTALPAEGGPPPLVNGEGSRRSRRQDAGVERVRP